MKLPPVKNLTRAQAMKYYEALGQYYGLPSLKNYEVKPQRLTKRQRELEAARNSGYSRGRQAAEEDFRREKEALQSQKARRDELLKCVAAGRDYISVVGQTLESFARIMQSEANQL